MPPKQTTWIEESDLSEMSTDEEEEDDDDDDLPLVRPDSTSVLPPIQTIEMQSQADTSASASAPTHSPVRPKSTRPSTQSATQKSKARGGLKPVATTLKPVRYSNFAISSLFTWMEQGLLDLDAEYQRAVVWKEEKQVGLIDSIFHNFPILPLVFVVRSEDENGEWRTCVDGKQRLTSIRRFIRGEIPYRDPTTNAKLYFNPISTAFSTTTPTSTKTRRKTISLAMQNTFMNKQIACYEYEDVTPEQEREIFQRVQLGMALGPAERLAAINGPYADLVRDMRKHIIAKPGLKDFLDWGAASGRNFQALAQILYLIVHGTEPTHKRLNTFLAQPAPDASTFAQLERKTLRTLDVFCAIRMHDVLCAPLLDNLSVLEFVMAVYLVHLYHHKCAPAQLSDAIRQMREFSAELRGGKEKGKEGTEKGKLANFKHVLGFVVKQVPRLTLRTTVGEDGVPRVPVSTLTATATPAKKIVQKRKRNEEQLNGEKDHEVDDSDEEYVVPVKRKKIVPPTKSKQTAGKKGAAAPLTSAPDPKASTKEKAKSRSKFAGLKRPAAGASKAKTMVKKSPKRGGTASGSGSASTAMPAKTKTAPATTLPSKPRPVVADHVAHLSGPGVPPSSARLPAHAARTSSATLGSGGAPTPPPSAGTPAPAPASIQRTSTPLPALPNGGGGSVGRVPLPGRSHITAPGVAPAPAPSSPAISQPAPSSSAAAGRAVGQSPAATSFNTSGTVVNTSINVQTTHSASTPISQPARAGNVVGNTNMNANTSADRLARDVAKGVRSGNVNGIGTGRVSSPSLVGPASVGSPSVNPVAGGAGTASIGNRETGQGAGGGSGTATAPSKFPKINKNHPQQQSPLATSDKAPGFIRYASDTPSGYGLGSPGQDHLKPSLSRRDSSQQRQQQQQQQHVGKPLGGGKMAANQVLVPPSTTLALANNLRANNGAPLATPASTPSPITPLPTSAMKLPLQGPPAASSLSGWPRQQGPGQGQGPVLYQVPLGAQAAFRAVAQPVAAAAAPATRDPRSARRSNGTQGQNVNQN